MYKKILLIFSLVFLFTSCSSTPNKKLKISTSTWIGYAPLFYAKEKGWLKELNIKLLNVSSLGENMYLYKSGNSDAYTGTQYEFSVLSQKNSDLTPILLFDRSNGGDIILSNITANELKNTDKPIDAFLEIDSINSTILEYYLSIHNLKNKQINYINQDQTSISSLKTNNLKNPTIIVTYAPYNITLEKNGFIELASTKDSLDLIVIDAMFTKTNILEQHEKQFIALKKIINKSVLALDKNPKEFYETVKPYMLDMSYDNFTETLNDIIWINKKLSKDLKNRMNEINVPTRNLL